MRVKQGGSMIGLATTLWIAWLLSSPAPQHDEVIPTVEPTPAKVVLGEGFIATRYGVSYQGQTMLCGGQYDTADTSILAVRPGAWPELPCGARARITAPSGRSVDVVRTDGCPGCGKYHLDLSEAGIATLCGHACDRIDHLTVELVAP